MNFWTGQVDAFAQQIWVDISEWHAKAECGLMLTNVVLVPMRCIEQKCYHLIIFFCRRERAYCSGQGQAGEADCGNHDKFRSAHINEKKKGHTLIFH